MFLTGRWSCDLLPLQDVNGADQESRTPLHYASGFDHAEIAQMLIDEGADLKARDTKGNTPLHYAAGYGSARLVSTLGLSAYMRS